MSQKPWSCGFRSHHPERVIARGRRHMRRWRRRMGIEPTSDSDCRSTVLKLANRTSLTSAETAFPQVRGLVRCPLLSATDPSVPLVMAREWHASGSLCVCHDSSLLFGSSIGRRYRTLREEAIALQHCADLIVESPQSQHRGRATDVAHPDRYERVVHVCQCSDCVDATVVY